MGVPVSLLEKCCKHDARDARQQRGPLVGGVRREDVHDGMRGAEENALERLVGHGPCLRLDALGAQHVAHGHANHPVGLAGPLGHPAISPFEPA